MAAQPIIPAPEGAEPFYFSTISGVTTAAHFGRCVNASGATVAGCTVNGPSFYNPANTTGQLTGTASLRWQSERLGGAYDVEWRSSTTDTFPNQIIYASGTVMAVTGTYDPANLVIGSSRVCKQGSPPAMRAERWSNATTSYGSELTAIIIL